MTDRNRRPQTAGTAVLNARRRRKRAVIVCMILASVFVLTMAMALMRLSDDREYNNYMNQAQELFYSKDYDGALSVLRRAAAVEKTDECLMLMADCYQTQGNYAKTLEVLRQMDTGKPRVASRIDEVEALRKNQGTTESVQIAGRDYPVNTTRLVLDGRSLSDASLEEITQLYAVDSLSLANNNLRDISRLAGLGGLVTLNLSGNNISDIRALSYLSSLRTLYLDQNPISDFSPLYTLQNLKSLSIKGIEITESQLQTLSNALPNCAIHSEKAQHESQNFSFGGMTFSSDITDLDLSNMGIWDISALSSCQYLTRLNLSGNSIIDLSPLMNLPYLQWLDISYNDVSDLRPLMGISTLTFLNASGNSINSTSAVSMMQGLSTLYLDENPIRDFSGLRRLKSLSTLGLSRTGLYDEALRYLAGLSNLSSLNITDNIGLTGAAVDQLKSAIPSCMINHSALSVDIDFGRYRIPSDSTELRIVGEGLTDISSIQRLNELRSVNLSTNSISNIYPLLYADCRHTLVSLNLSYNIISDPTPLAALTAIQTLDLSNNSITSLQPLMGLTTLRTLYLTGNPLSQEEIIYLRMALPDCDVFF